MNVARILCWLGRHDWSRYRRMPFQLVPNPGEWQYYKRRTCKRCRIFQDAPMRPPNPADTIQGATKP